MRVTIGTHCVHLTTSPLALLDPSSLTASVAGSAAGAVAQAALAADAVAVSQWIILVSLRPVVAEVSATVNALRRLRTNLRSGRPTYEDGVGVSRAPEQSVGDRTVSISVGTEL